MSVFSAVDFSHHEKVVFSHDEESGLKAVIAIHNTVRGPALGGCRMWPYETEEMAIADALRLSRGMTYKSAIVNLNYGGGKAVIIGDPKKDKSEALLRAYGKLVQSLNGQYFTGEDVGMTVPDMDIVAQETDYALGLSNGTGDPSGATAFGVFRGIEAAITHSMNRIHLDGLRVAVQGLGNVGYNLCKLLHEAGAVLTVADVDQERVQRVVSEFAARVAPADTIHAADVDVYAPCALGAVVNDQTFDGIKATIIAGSANNQLAVSDFDHMLMAKGILYAPDYVVNGGGLIDISNTGNDYDENASMGQVGMIYDRLLEIFERSARMNIPTGQVADRMAEEKFMPDPHMEHLHEAA